MWFKIEIALLAQALHRSCTAAKAQESFILHTKYRQSPQLEIEMKYVFSLSRGYRRTAVQRTYGNRKLPLKE
jgi:hypothetical protein